MIIIKNRTNFNFFSLIFRSHVIIKWFRLSYFQFLKRIINIETFSLKIIVKIFDIITQTNIMIKSQRYISFVKFHQIKNFYQNIIRCDINTIFVTIISIVDIFENNFSLNKFNIFEKNFHNDIFENEKKISTQSLRTTIRWRMYSSSQLYRISTTIRAYQCYQNFNSSRSRNEEIKNQKSTNSTTFLISQTFMLIYIWWTTRINTRKSWIWMCLQMKKNIYECVCKWKKTYINVFFHATKICR